MAGIHSVRMHFSASVRQILKQANPRWLPEWNIKWLDRGGFVTGAVEAGQRSICSYTMTAAGEWRLPLLLMPRSGSARMHLYDAN